MLIIVDAAVRLFIKDDARTSSFFVNLVFLLICIPDQLYCSHCIIRLSRTVLICQMFCVLFSLAWTFPFFLTFPKVWWIIVSLEARKWRCPKGQNLPLQSFWRGKSHIFSYVNLHVNNSFGVGAKSFKIFHLGGIFSVPPEGTKFLSHSSMRPKSIFYVTLHLLTDCQAIAYPGCQLCPWI